MCVGVVSGILSLSVRGCVFLQELNPKVLKLRRGAAEELGAYGADASLSIACNYQLLVLDVLRHTSIDAEKRLAYLSSSLSLHQSGSVSFQRWISTCIKDTLMTAARDEPRLLERKRSTTIMRTSVMEKALHRCCKSQL
ncbi:unnamed protein product [Pleuronectes platessa]|uniref:Uncharacterized protein n=1 Tax=Pleuronectes platessa TaxID=8262 RepID=A0A9N7YUI2_PLEPL|nr:unnamed protein product [Pleuronectes platessa]